MHAAPRPASWPARLSALLLSLLLAASVVSWLLHWPQPDAGPALAPVTEQPEGAPPPDAARLAQLLGVPAASAQAAQPLATPQAASRFQLLGIIAGPQGQGVALLAVDGKPARPFAAGSMPAAGWVLQSVQARSVALGADAQGPASLQLALPRQP